MAATPSPNYADKALLSADPIFIGRVRQAMIGSCISIMNEATKTTPYSRERETFGAACMNQPDSYKLLFAMSVATDATVIAAATSSGATPLTSGNVAAQAVLVPDSAIDTAIASQFNTFFRTPAQ